MKFRRLIAAVISVMKRGFFKLISVIRESKLVCCDCLVVMDDSRMSSCIKANMEGNSQSLFKCRLLYFLSDITLSNRVQIV